MTLHALRWVIEHHGYERADLLALADGGDDDAAELARLTDYQPCNAPTPPSSRSRRRPISQRLRTLVMERNQYRCVRCGTFKDLTIDHVIPVSKGGTNDPDNLQTLCGSCNSRKGAR